jgi:hypothetical protein
MDMDNYESETHGGQNPLCPECGYEFAIRIHRSFLFKVFFFWLPVRRFYCYKCRKKQYVRLKYHQESQDLHM